MSLRVVRRPDGGAPSGDARPIVAAGTRIGRAPECDLVLDDVLRLVSRQHAWLAPHAADAALLKCISSTAAIHVNGEPVPPGAERLVHDGDVLKLGGFEVLVEIEPQTVVVKRPVLRPTAPPVAAPPPQPMVPAASAPAVIAEPRVPAAPAQLPAPPPVVVPPPLATPAAAAVSMPRRPATVSAGIANPSPRVSAQPPARGPRLDRYFELDTVRDPLGPDSPLPIAEPPTRAEPVRAQSILRDATPHPVPTAPPAPVPAAQAFGDSLSRAALRVTEPVAPPVAPAPVMTSSAPGDALQALRAAFLQGAGLEDDAEFQLDPAWMEHLGALLRASTDGTLALLRSRAVAKRSIRAENTQIVARENNPLKFAPDGVHALLLLLSLQSKRGFLDPVAAVRDAHHDLQVHQLAMAAGMRAAVFDLISRFGPEATEAAEGPAHGLAQSIPALRDASLWRRHKLGYERMLENLDDVFEVAFGREFLKAYEAQAKKTDPPPGAPEA